ncbi:alkaline phosphatase family protein [Nonomuraea sp. NPDC049141]|uniref:alkaline phosphatase family protein n=1 Tax=Nonomuraea sp. NPDC049141 TaxID=3155500 RepID=UPI0033D8D874
MKDKVLVVGMDGLRFDRLLAVGPPELTGLMSRGAYGTSLLPYGEATAPRTESPGEIVPETTSEPAEPDQRSAVRVIRSRTDSGPGWSSIATGVWPDKHGVVDNAFTRQQFAKYPDFLTRAKTARPDLDTAAFFSWASLAEHGAFGPAIDTRFVLDGYTIDWPIADKQVAEAAERHLASAGADLTFVYLGETDEVAHDLGPHCPEYTKALHTQDSYLGRLLDAIRGRRTFADERWTVLVTTDHGHIDDGGHGGTSVEERTVFVIAATLGEDLGGADLGGPRLVDVGLTALARLGIEPDPGWGLDGVPLEV